MDVSGSILVSGVVDGTDGVNGQNSVRIDLDNQADLVSLDSEGKVKIAHTVTVHARIYDGGSPVTANVSNATTDSLVIGGCTPPVTMVSGVLTVIWAFTKGMAAAAAAKTIKLRYNNVDYEAVFTLGTIDRDAVWQVMPLPSEVKFSRDDTTNALTPSSQTLKCGYTKATGSGTESVAEATTTSGQIVHGSANSGMYLYYRAKTGNSWGSWTAYPSAGISIGSDDTQTDYEFCITYGAIANDGSNIEDRECVPVVKDGANGTSPYLADIDNETVSVACTYDGKTTAAFDKTVNVKMWHGSQEQALTALSTTSHSGITITPSRSGKTVRVQIAGGVEIPQVTDITITTACEGSGNQTLHLYINGVRQGKEGDAAVLYDLIPSASSVKRDKNGTLTPTSLTCDVQRTEGTSVSRATSSQGTLYYLKNGDITSASTSGIQTLTINTGSVSLASTDTYVVFAFFVGTTMVDKERVPIVYDGNDGKAGDNAPYDIVTYGRSKSNTNYGSGYLDTSYGTDGWGSTAPAATGTYPYIWEKRVHKDKDGNTTGTSYICLSQEKAKSVYALTASASVVKFTKNYAGVVSANPSSFQLTIQYDGASITLASANSSGYYIYYRRNGSSSWSRVSSLSQSSGTIFSDGSYTTAEYCLSTASSYSNVSDSNIIDRTTVTAVWEVQRMLLPAGAYTSKQYVRTANTTPLVYYSGKYWFLVADNNGTTTFEAPRYGSTVWQQASEFEVILTKILFAQVAQLGAFMIRGDWMYSQYGTFYDDLGAAHVINAETEPFTTNAGEDTITKDNAYEWFDKEYPDTFAGGDGNFCPSFAVNALTGVSYENNAHIRGTVYAVNGAFEGKVTASGINLSQHILDSTSDRMVITSPGVYTLNMEGPGAITVDLDGTDMEDGDIVTLIVPIDGSVQYINNNLMSNGWTVDNGILTRYEYVIDPDRSGGQSISPGDLQPENSQGLYIQSEDFIYGIGGIYPVMRADGSVAVASSDGVRKLYFCGGTIELIKMGGNFYTKSKQCQFFEAVVSQSDYGFNVVIVESCGRLIATANSNNTWAW